MKGYLLILLLMPVCAFAQLRVTLKGKVIDANSKPVEFASVLLNETNYASYTDTAGNFEFAINSLQFATLTIRISMVGKATITKVIRADDYAKPQLFVMQELSLTLNEVWVSAQQKKSNISNSSIVFDRQAIEQVQAYSLADVLNNLPGKVSSAPDLQYRQNITLRTAASADPVQQAMNSTGVAIYVDGIRQSNDANMQSRSVGVWGLSSSVVTNRKDPLTGNISYDTPFSGLDTRTIPVDNVESIEVVSGVASAKYGEVTDGAIIINRMAGKTDYQANVRLNGSSTNTSLSKGFYLGKRAGALNVNVNYLNSIQNPTNSLKNYGRISAGTMWTTYISKAIKNTFSADLSYKIDHAKIDPDADNPETEYSKQTRIGFTNRTSYQIDSKWLNRATLNLSYDVSKEETYRQRYYNGSPQAVANKDTTGIYEGYYIPGNFLSTDQLLGEPYNASASIDLNSIFHTGRIGHEISYGATTFLSGNNGRGQVADPNLPPTNIASGSFKSERPYRFDLIRPIVNFGFYAEDRVKFNVINRPLSISAGVRYDLQNGYPSFQPRINTSYQLNKRWSLRAAYGISTKSPSLSVRYPGPTYFDVPIVNLSNGNANQSLYLVYTRKIEHDNSYLKPSRSSQAEFGINADYGFFNASVFGYAKKDRDGFNTTATYLPIYLPVYTVVTKTGQKPVATKTSATKLYAGLADNQIGNNVQSDNYGVEFYLSTHKIQAIQTSFTFNTSFAYTQYNNTGTTIQPAAESRILSGATAWYGVYPGNNSRNISVLSKLNSDTHIPKLGFVVSLIMDVHWKNTLEYLGKSTYPLAYIDKNGNTVPIPVFDANNTDYNYLLLTPDAATKVYDPPFAYASLSLRIAKEIRKKVRVSLFAYNFLDTKIQYVNPATQDYTTYGNPINVGAEISFKF